MAQFGCVSYSFEFQVHMCLFQKRAFKLQVMRRAAAINVAVQGLVENIYKGVFCLQFPFVVDKKKQFFSLDVGNRVCVHSISPH